MNYLVIGGAGFVGSHLAESLVKKGNEVSVVDNYFTGTKKNHVEGVSYFQCEAENVGEIDFKKKIDVIFHLGEYSRVEQSFRDLNLVFQLNFKSIFPVLNLWQRHGAKLIYSGSSTKFAEYGEEDMISPYAWTKKTNVDLVINYSKWNNLPYAVTYFYNVYGGREIGSGRYSTVIAKFLRLKGAGATTLPVTAPGTQLRNFTHISDIVAGLEIVAEKGVGDGFGIGADEAVSILEVARLLGCEPELVDPQPGNRLSATLATSKTKALGWEPRVALKNYLHEMNLKLGD